MVKEPTPLHATWIGWLLLILLTAVFLRLWQIDQIPPGITHDEADHGITAWDIVQGERAIYFTVGYGREPLFDYATAITMAGLGPTYLAGRLTAVFFSLVILLGLFSWVQRLFDTPTALLAVAGVAVGFWAVMASRQMLRSITLPALFTLAILFYTHALLTLEQSGRRSWIQFGLCGVLLGLTIYTYIPARVMWVVVPLTAVYHTLLFRQRRVWYGTGLVMGIASIIALPLLLFLRANPELEVRINELSTPLTAVQNGDWQPLLTNSWNSLRLFFIEGDSTWRYNIAGQPWLSPGMAIFFLLGAAILLWWCIRPLRQPATQAQKWRGVAAIITLLWLGGGLSPVLVTGPTLSSTQAIGMQPVLYLLPAVGLRQAGSWLSSHLPDSPWQRRVGWAVPLLLFGTTAVFTVRDYFVVWGQHPEVRVQYESTMMAAMDYLNEQTKLADATVSTITPGQFHTPALAEMSLTRPINLRWFDATGSLLLPNATESELIVPRFTPVHPALRPYLNTAVLHTTLPLRPSDIDRPLDIYQLTQAAWQAELRQQFTAVQPQVQIGEAARLLGVDIQTAQVSPGETVRVASLWQLLSPIQADARLFTHLRGDEERPLAQADRLDAPVESWQAGDWLIQLHEFTLPPETAVGTYPLVIGMYLCQPSCEQGQRLTFTVDGAPAGDTYLIGDVIVR